MRRAVLLFNPSAGRRPHLRLRLMEEVAAALRTRGLTVEILATEGPGTAGRQAAEACTAGADILFACGGDGTVHEIVQGIAFQSDANLGIIPLGSANALARHLGLSMNPVKAALQQLNYQPTLIPLGKLTCQSAHGERTRYFAVMAGAGPDGALVYKMLTDGKHRFGRSMYYLRAASLFLRARFSPFSVTDLDPVTGSPSTQQAVSAMAVRVGDLGGLFSPLVRGAAVEHAHLLLTLTSTPAYASLPAWFAMSWARLHRWNHYTRSKEVQSFRCEAGATQPVHVQADGEWIGHTPMSVAIVPNALRLLMPPFKP